MKFCKEKILILIIWAYVFSGCNTSELISLNENPTATTEMDWNYLFTLGILYTAENGYVYANRCRLNYCSAMIQHLSDISQGYFPGDKYFKAQDYSGVYFKAYYLNMSKNFSEVIKQTGPEGKSPELINLYNAARVMKVFALHRCTDLYGDVPNSEANKAYDDGTFFPKFDTQESIYLDMLTELSEAARGFDDNYVNKNFNFQDIIYKGEISKWKKFAYSMMLRLAMRISKVDPSTAQIYLSEAIEGGLFTSNSDNAFIPMADGPDKRDISINQNGISKAYNPNYGPVSGTKLCKSIVDFLRDNNDPRLMIISGGIGTFGSSDKILDPSLQNGIPHGKDVKTIMDYEGVTEDVNLDLTYSRINELLLDLDDPILLQTYAEVELLLSEAAVKGWYGGDPVSHYNNGVRAAMQMYYIFDPSLVVSDEEVNNYLVIHPFEPSKAMEMIGTQYWIATFLNYYEAYANWRRTGYPMLTPSNYPGNDTNGTIPRRLTFNLSDVSRNEANYLAAIERMGGDLLTTRVWWDDGN